MCLWQKGMDLWLHAVTGLCVCDRERGGSLARFIEQCVYDTEVDGSLARFMEQRVCDRKRWISG